MSRFGGTVFKRVLIAALIPFALLFGAAWFALGRVADGAGIVVDAPTLLVAGGVVFALLVICVFFAAQGVARPMRRIAERADAVTGDGCDAAFDDVPIGGAPQEIASLRDALVRMTDLCARENARKRTVLQAELTWAREIESAEARHRFFTNISDRICTPMNAIVGIAQLILNEPPGGRQEEYAAGIKASAESLLSAVRDILDLSKMESGEFVLENADYDFGEMLTLIRGQTAALVADKPLVVFEMSVDESVPGCLWGDEARMLQMLTNLLRSAANSTHRGFVRFHARADEHDLHFDISGSNVRVRQEDLPKRLDTARLLSDSSGDGLRLAISKFLAVAMDGSIKVEHARENGATFRVTVPRADGNIAAAASRRRVCPFKAPKARVLIVDDKEANLNVATGLLSFYYEISCDRALTGRDAIDLIRRNDYDIVFIDLWMPDMDGAQTTGIIRAQGGAFGELPIVAVAASAAFETGDGFASSGFNDVLTKPIDTERLREVLLKWLPERVIVLAGERAKEEAEPVAYTRVIEAAAEIGELDVSLGLGRMAGRQDLYERALRMTLEKSHLMAGALVSAASRGDFDSVRLHAHAAKNSFSDIGATRLAILAADLERAAKAGDMAFCRENTPHFIDRLGCFVEALSEVFERTPAREEPHDEDALAPGIARIRAAMDSSDFEAALAASGELAAEAEKSGRSEKFQLLRNALEHFDYDAAAVLLDKVQEERQG